MVDDRRYEAKAGQGTAAKLTSAAPCFSVQDPRASATWYREKLGFQWAEVFGPPPEHDFFAIVGRDQVRIMLRFTRDGPGTRPWVPDADQPLFDAYFDVADVDGLYAEFRANGIELAEPVDRIYGMREISVTDPDDHTLIFGQATAPSQLPSTSL